MKELSVLVLFFVWVGFSAKVWTQSLIGLYVWEHSVVMQQYDNQGENEGKGILSKPGQKFRVVTEVQDDSVFIQILNYIDGKDIPSPRFYVYNFNNAVDTFDALSKPVKKAREWGSDQVYFKVPVDHVQQYASTYQVNRSSLAVGAITLPFKFRPQETPDYAGSFNFSVAGGLKFRHKSTRRFHHSWLISVGISNIELDTATVRKNKDLVLGINDFSALTLSTGYLLEYNQVQAGIFIGIDQISAVNQQRFDWIYQGKPWLSLGLGYAIFSKEKAATDVTDQRP